MTRMREALGRRMGWRGRTGRSAAEVVGFPFRGRLERRSIVLLAAGMAFLAVAAARQTSSDTADAVELLYVVPIALVALELGLVAGVLAAALASALVGVWLATSTVDVELLGLIGRGLAYLAVGGLGGRFADRMRDAQARHRFLLQSGLALAQLEPDEDLASTLAELAGKATLPATTQVALGEGPVVRAGGEEKSRWEETLPVHLRGVRYGTLTVGTARPLAAEDRATLAILALQAAVAAENRQLLESERERAVIRGQLDLAQTHLAERSGQLREFMARQEAERNQVSQELHDDAAQVLAAVQLSLKALERQLGTGGRPEKWQALRADIDATLQSLRSLAISLRPPVLRLGLQAALEDLGEHARDQGVGEFEVALQAVDGISPELETMVFRVVQEAVDSVGPAARVTVSGDHGSVLEIEVRQPETPIADERLGILKARVDMMNGTMTTTPELLRAVIPLHGDQAPEPRRPLPVRP